MAGFTAGFVKINVKTRWFLKPMAYAMIFLGVPHLTATRLIAKYCIKYKVIHD